MPQDNPWSVKIESCRAKASSDNIKLQTFIPSSRKSRNPRRTQDQYGRLGCIYKCIRVSPSLVLTWPVLGLILQYASHKLCRLICYVCWRSMTSDQYCSKCCGCVLSKSISTLYCTALSNWWTTTADLRILLWLPPDDLFCLPWLKKLLLITSRMKTISSIL